MRKLWKHALLLALIAAAWLVLSWMLWPSAVTLGPGVAPESDAGAQEAAGGSAMPSARPLDSKSDRQAIVNAPTGPGDAPKPVDGPIRSAIRIVSPDGQPQPNVTAIVQVLIRRRGKSPRSTQPVVSTTDAEGKFSISADEPFRVDLESDDDNWKFRSSVEISTDATVVDCIARPLVTIEVLGFYTDGLPYEGYAYVHAGHLAPHSPLGFATWSHPDSYSRSFYIDGRSPAVLKRVPLGADLRFSMSGRRVGYPSQNVDVGHMQVVPGRPLALVLAGDPKNKMGQVEFDWTGIAPSGATRVTLTLAGGTAAFSGGVLDRQSPWRSELVMPGEYMITVSTKPPWQSPVIRVESRAVTRVVYAPALSGAVTAHVVDDSGAPIAGAILTRDHAVYPNLDRPFQAGPQCALSNAAGRLTLADVPVGPQKLLIEARGYEPQVLEVGVVEGDANDCGTITLRRAGGRVVVRLQGMRPRQSYTVMVIQPGGLPVRTLKGVTSDVVTFEALPQRLYVVAVVAGKGGNVASANVQLTEQAPEHDVTLDVAELREEGLAKKD